MGLFSAKKDIKKSTIDLIQDFIESKYRGNESRDKILNDMKKHLDEMDVEENLEEWTRKVAISDIESVEAQIDLAKADIDMLKEIQSWVKMI